MVPNSIEPPDPFDHPFGDENDLVFLRDEGLELLAQFKRIKDKAKRGLVVQLIRMLADDQPER